MEKQSFSLSSASERRWQLANGLFYVALALLALLCDHRKGAQVIWAVALVVALVVLILRYIADKSRLLEITDRGLTEVTRLPHKVLTVLWDQISSVRLQQGPTFESREVAPVSAWINDSRRHVITVPAVCPDSERIVQILRQRLPDEVFQRVDYRGRAIQSQ